MNSSSSRSLRISNNFWLCPAIYKNGINITFHSSGKQQTHITYILRPSWGAVGAVDIFSFSWTRLQAIHYCKQFHALQCWQLLNSDISAKMLKHRLQTDGNSFDSLQVPARYCTEILATSLLKFQNSIEVQWASQPLHLSYQWNIYMGIIAAHLNLAVVKPFCQNRKFKFGKLAEVVFENLRGWVQRDYLSHGRRHEFQVSTDAQSLLQWFTVGVECIAQKSVRTETSNFNTKGTQIFYKFISKLLQK